ncbi:MAG: DNA replication complex GINS family protein [Methanosphaera stadtmanae]|nr:DNA replication complex GINS family protein [Methanosphaera stadtmanae]
MDTFFQKLRDIQKKERTTGTLSEIDDSFYSDASNYLQELLKKVNNNPLSLEAYQLRDAQRITTEICERREFKIVSTAATNIQKSHDIFKGHKNDSELYDVIPYNTTPEEEEFYRKLVDMMIDHREHLMEKIIINNKSNETKIGFKPHKKEIKEEKTEHVDVSPADEKTSEIENKEELTKSKESSKPKPPILDESQIAMMFGQAPDDTLLDENNNPVKPVKRDITTPFKGPKPPKEDSVTLQNIPEKESETKVETELEFKEEIVDTNIETETEELELNDVELVEFKQEISTDILDENEKTYGPFFEDDIVLLPKSIVKILSKNDVIEIIE